MHNSVTWRDKKRVGFLANAFTVWKGPVFPSRIALTEVLAHSAALIPSVLHFLSGAYRV